MAVNWRFAAVMLCLFCTDAGRANYLVSIKRGEEHSCYATLIDPRHAVLTADCISDGFGYYLDLLNATTRISVDIRSLTVVFSPSSLVSPRRVTSYTLNPSWDPRRWDSTAEHDEAIIGLNSSVNVEPVRLLSADVGSVAFPPGSKARVLHFREIPSRSTRARARARLSRPELIAVTVTKLETCQKAYPLHLITGQNNLFCAQADAGQNNICRNYDTMTQDDTGVPLLVRRGGDWLQAATAISVPRCGKEPKPSLFRRQTDQLLSSVLEGEKAAKGIPAHLFQSIVTVKHHGTFRCFGGVTCEQTVAVPAQCVASTEPKDLTVVYGQTKLDGQGLETRAVAAINVDPRWDPSGQTWSHDQAVLLVNSSVSIGASIRTVTLADQGSVFPPDTRGVTFAWSDDGELISIDVKVVPQMRCENMHDHMVTDDMVCTGLQDGEDTCEVQSALGAPLFLKGQKDVWVMAALTIRGYGNHTESFLPLVYGKPGKTSIVSAHEELTCGLQNPPCPGCPGDQPRVDGEEALPNSWPCMAYVKDQQGRFAVAAILLNKNYALTTDADYVEPGDTLVLGDQNRYTISGKEQCITIDEVITHPDFDWDTRSHQIVLLKLSTPAQFNKNVRPICLPREGEETPLGSACFLTGWGGRDSHGFVFLHDELRQIQSVPSDLRCGREHENWDYNTTFCSEPGKKPSWNDLGAPLMCKNNTIWKLFGAMSGFTYWVDPAEPTSTAYARITALRSWIEDRINYPGWKLSFKKFDG